MLINPYDLYPENAGKPAFTLLDVRAPVEVAKGALPFSVEEPILTNEERHQVGIRYKEDGQQAAIDLGYELTRPFLQERIKRWREVSQRSPTAVMCWRGGLRSKLAHEFIDLPNVARLQGGYKALRNYLLGTLPKVLERKQVLVLTGLTGVGKTEVLRELGSGSRFRVSEDGEVVTSETRNPKPETHSTSSEKIQSVYPALHSLDLEYHAHHKGSAFGNLGEQPSQQTFDNALAVETLLNPAKTVLLEDESFKIGKLFLPEALWEKIKTAPLVVLEDSKEERVQRIFEEYVLEETKMFGAEKTFEKISTNFLKLRERLGHKTMTECLEEIELAKNCDWLGLAAHTRWIELLLENYYDPLYKKSMTKHERPILFRGNAEECKDWLSNKAMSNEQ
jgi:tRNA 2-selenouridine synthase